jgi:hypothetical protein
MTDFADLTDERLLVLSELAAGNGAPLAKHLESGGDLSDDLRAVLIKYLRGELRLSRGNRRTYAQFMKEDKIRDRLKALQFRFAVMRGSRGAYSRAIEAYLEIDPSVGEETVRKYAKRGLLSKAILDAIDLAMQEASEGNGVSKSLNADPDLRG